MSEFADAKTVEKVVPQTSAVKSFLSGGFGGIASVLVGHPFDLAKVRIQTSPTGTYKGTFDVFGKSLKADGVRGLYRGMSTPLVGVTPIFAVSFWAYDLGKKIVHAIPGREPRDLNLAEFAFAGFFSAVPTTLLMSPTERIKVILQTQGSGVNKLYNGPVDVARALYKEGGMASIFRGTGATLLRDGPGSAAYFVAYEVIKRSLIPAGGTAADLNPLSVLFAGGMAGVAMWTIAIPPDVLKSRLQSAPAGTYKGVADVLRVLLKNEGPQALFKGLGPAMLRAFPANAACFLGVEYSLRAMNMVF
ncbi:mitochondrial carrier domain-containing protein [Linnemannia elongata]|uniref:Mitochondrial carrier n=1 Tax=Linnemannia elongata AG-77 TaxID=1314771 RepID=A0A197JPI1_9FUNG|nr:carnitine transporter [Linnemannia elongata]OAQ26391.1 mitochondrial carrier [Linnemannia elongata AG-77]KAF9333097.1 carnitine transporter [Linnemannia elongata]KAG0057913.1 carnitine transporter [Linnemannia elongata]KAG0071919.1 carnitine transporter [Linnemannia elongata]